MTGNDQLAAAIDDIMQARRLLPAFASPPNLWDELAARGFVIQEVVDPHDGVLGVITAWTPDHQLGGYVFDWEAGSAP